MVKMTSRIFGGRQLLKGRKNPVLLHLRKGDSMRNITKMLFGLSLQIFALFCLIFAYAERESNEIAFPAFAIAAASM